MAQDRATNIDMPALDNKDGKGRLVLETGKGYRGGVKSDYKVVHVGDRMFIHVFGCQGMGGCDLRGVIKQTPGTCTQKKIDAQHAEVFTPEVIEQLKAKALAYYKVLAAV